jgi:hypothetical protein
MQVVELYYYYYAMLMCVCFLSLIGQFTALCKEEKAEIYTHLQVWFLELQGSHCYQKPSHGVLHCG